MDTNNNNTNTNTNTNNNTNTNMNGTYPVSIANAKRVPLGEANTNQLSQSLGNGPSQQKLATLSQTTQAALELLKTPAASTKETHIQRYPVKPPVMVSMKNTASPTINIKHTTNDGNKAKKRTIQEMYEMDKDTETEDEMCDEDDDDEDEDGDKDTDKDIEDNGQNSRVELQKDDRNAQQTTENKLNQYSKKSTYTDTNEYTEAQVIEHIKKKLDFVNTFASSKEEEDDELREEDRKEGEKDREDCPKISTQREHIGKKYYINKPTRPIGGASMVIPTLNKILPINSSVQEINGRARLMTTTSIHVDTMVSNTNNKNNNDNNDNDNGDKNSLNVLKPNGKKIVKWVETENIEPRPTFAETRANALSGKKVIKLVEAETTKPVSTLVTPIETTTATMTSSKKTSTTAQNTDTSMHLKTWQNNWRSIMKKEATIYFDISDKKILQQKLKEDKDFLISLETLKAGYLSLGANITSTFDSKVVTIVISLRGNNPSFLKSLPESDSLKKAFKNDLKIWNLDKAARFLTNMDVELNKLRKRFSNPVYANLMTNVDVYFAKYGTISTTNSTTSTITNNNNNNNAGGAKLSQYLQNEKLYGPMDRDPMAKRDDMHYFNKDRPHVYIYDSSQQFAPLVVMEWKLNTSTDQEDKNSLGGSNSNLNMNLPYPTLKNSTFGRCPFIPDNEDELSKKRVFKRFKRDKNQEAHAMFLKRLYSVTATPKPDNDIYLIDSSEYNNSEKMFVKTFHAQPEEIFENLPNNVSVSKISTTQSKQSVKKGQTGKETLEEVIEEEDEEEEDEEAEEEDEQEEQQQQQQQNKEAHNTVHSAKENEDNTKLPCKAVWKRPPVKKNIIPMNLLRMETTGLDDFFMQPKSVLTNATAGSPGVSNITNGDNSGNASRVSNNTSLHSNTVANNSNTKKRTVILSEIKASGMLNNDTSLTNGGVMTEQQQQQGNQMMAMFRNNNGLSATKSSVIGKNLSALNNKFVMDTPLGSPAPDTESHNVSHNMSHNISHIGTPPVNNVSANNSTQIVFGNILNNENKKATTNKPTGVNNVQVSKIVSSIKTKKSIINSNPTTTASSIQKKPNTVAINAVIRDKKMGGGYCENCRVKYDSLRAHIKTEKHVEFSQNDFNFQAIDSLIENVHSSMYY